MVENCGTVDSGRRVRTIVLEFIGAILLGLGVLGVFLPIIPTTPFVLAAAFCFSANPVMYNRIVNSPFFGEYIRAYREGKGIKTKTRIKSIAFLWAVLIITMLFFMTEDWHRILLSIVGICVTVHLLTICRGNKC